MLPPCCPAWRLFRLDEVPIQTTRLTKVSLRLRRQATVPQKCPTPPEPKAFDFPQCTAPSLPGAVLRPREWVLCCDQQVLWKYLGWHQPHAMAYDVSNQSSAGTTVQPLVAAGLDPRRPGCFTWAGAPWRCQSRIWTLKPR